MNGARLLVGFGTLFILSFMTLVFGIGGFIFAVAVIGILLWSME